jgi:hypothetical protein
MVGQADKSSALVVWFRLSVGMEHLHFQQNKNISLLILADMISLLPFTNLPWCLVLLLLSFSFVCIYYYIHLSGCPCPYLQEVVGWLVDYTCLPKLNYSFRSQSRDCFETSGINKFCWRLEKVTSFVHAVLTWVIDF